MQSSSVSINLVKTKINLSEEVTRWALTIGRLIIIITEIVAFSAFIYRFSLDRKLIDLRAEITQQQALVASLKDREETYRNIHERLALAKKVGEEGQMELAILKQVYEIGGTNIAFNNLSVNEEVIRVDATSGSISSFSNFIQSLKEYENIESVSVDRIDNSKDSSTINFSATAVLKQ